MTATYGSKESRYTVWHFIGCGCTVLVLLVLLVVGGLVFFGKQFVDGFKAGFEDPEVRAERAQKILGYDELPEGYHPGVSFSVPFVMEMAMLVDRELPAGEDVDEEEMEREVARSLFGRRGFFYFKVRRAIEDDAEEDLTRDMNIDLDFDLERELARGTVEAAGGDVTFVAHSGTLHGGEERRPAIITELIVTCLADPYGRKAIWFTAVSQQQAAAFAPAEPVAPGALEGTAADPEAVEAFLDHFDLCR